MIGTFAQCQAYRYDPIFTINTEVVEESMASHSILF